MCNHGFIFIYSLTFALHFFCCVVVVTNIYILLLYNEKAVESSETKGNSKTATLTNKVQSRAENEHIDEMVYILFIISHLFIKHIYDGI